MKPVDFRKINEIDLIIYHQNWKPRVFLWGKDPNAAFLYQATMLILESIDPR